MDMDFVALPAVALICTVFGAETLVAVAVKFAELIPGGTVTEAGTTRLVELLDSTNVIAEDGEDIRVTVHVVEPAPVIAASAQTREDMVCCATTTVNVADREEPLAVAVTCAVPAAALAATVVVKAALL